MDGAMVALVNDFASLGIVRLYSLKRLNSFYFLMKTVVLFAVISAWLYAGSLQAQEFGGNPPSVKWNQINISAGRIIFPTTLNLQGQRVASIVDHLYKDTSTSIGTTRKKINIVLQNQTTIANGYVALAPWRSEFLLSPATDNFELGTLASTDNLAIHEYRHVLQYSNYRKGLSRWLYYVAGESGQALANAAAIPNWFYEGDAVFNETSLSEQGRGRVPFFFNGYRSLWEAQKRYTYMKLRNGSYKSFVPNHYPLGYMLVGYGRMKYGIPFWTNVTDDAARFNGLFYPFQKAVKKYSGQPFNKFVQDAFAFYQQQSPTPAEPGKFVTATQRNNVIDYLFPQYIGNDTLLALKKSYRRNPQWVMIAGSKEEKIVTKSISVDDYYSYANGKIVYAAYEPDARWGWKDFSVIRLLDIKTGADRRVVGGSKYFSPDISADGQRIVVVDYTADQQCTLKLLKAENGQVISTVPNPDSLYYAHPKFFSFDEAVVSVRKRNGENAMAIVDLHTGKIQLITVFGYETADFAFADGDTVLFTASREGHDVIMLYDSKSKKLFRSVAVATGNYYAAMNDTGDEMVFSRFTADGYRLEKANLAAMGWIEENQESTAAPNLFVGSTLLQQGGEVLDKVPVGQFPVKHYSKFSHPFNFHSWLPYYDNPEWSLTLYGQNILNTFQTALSYTYNENEASHAIGFSGAYAAWYPWITGGITGTFHRSFRDSVGEVTWNEGQANLGLSLPLNFTAGKWYRFLTLSANVNGIQQYFTQQKDRYKDFGFLYMQYGLSYSAQIQKAVQQINPRLGLSLRLQDKQAITGLTANQALASASIYLPGLSINHSLVVSGSYQRRDTAQQYFFTNNFPFSRGYDAVDAPRMWRWSVNYHVPLWYPDWGFGQIVYFLRVRANLFYDDGAAKSLRTGQVFDFRTVGTEIYFDTRWWNEQPLSIGFRYSHLLDPNIAGSDNRNVFEIILPVIPLQ